jgi:GH15 family glucan-1,4-alpha-glucosidase
MSYQPIENYGVIGDMQTAALVGLNGSIDWFCFPVFDSPSVFAAILDSKKGGSYLIRPTDSYKVAHKQFYMPDSNVLVTRFLSPDGVGELIDFMPVVPLDKPEQRCLVRIVKAHGTMKFRVECRPAFNYARDGHEVEMTSDGACFHSPRLHLVSRAASLSSRMPDLLWANSNWSPSKPPHLCFVHPLRVAIAPPRCRIAK